MSELDEKLKKAIMLLARDSFEKGKNNDGFIVDLDSYVAGLKQAFAEAGYLKFPQSVQEAKLMDVADVRMTGLEWFNRFKAELHTELNKYSALEEEDYIEAARRAANISEDNT